MKESVLKLCFALLIAFLSGSLYAQEKTQAYYNTHESEILPDAKAAFQNGNYSRAALLCNWHYIIVGDNAADSLRDMAERCAQLSKEMNEFRSDGNVKEAKQKATAILSINPDDVSAKEVLSIEDPVPPIQDTVVVAPPVVRDSLVIPPPTLDQNKSNDNQKPGEIHSPFENVPSVPDATQQEHVQFYEPHTRFVVKAGATIVDLKQLSQTIAPGGALGLYDLGGSPIGLEAGFYLCSGLLAQSASLFGIDASLVFRASKSLYPKVGLGFFSCNSTVETGVGTKGLCAGLALSFLVGGHLCIEVGAKYYPEINLHGYEMVTTSGVSYEFPATIQVLAGGIAPMVSFGWAF